MAANSLCELCRFSQDLQQCAPAKPLEDITGIWNPLPPCWDQQSFYDNFTCCAGDGDILFEVHTGVRQGWSCPHCFSSSFYFFFNPVVDWIMWRTTEDQIRGIRWTPFSLRWWCTEALISYTHIHTQEKTQHLNTFKLASTSAARGPKLWHWILLTHDRSRLIMKNFLTKLRQIYLYLSRHPQKYQQGQKLAQHNE